VHGDHKVEQRHLPPRDTAKQRQPHHINVAHCNEQERAKLELTCNVIFRQYQTLDAKKTLL
jgi:hypothetical protein